MAKKNMGSTKRFGPRYGRTIKQKVDKLEALAKKKYKCPYCAAPKVNRRMAGIWECSGCKKVFTSKAYTIE